MGQAKILLDQLAEVGARVSLLLVEHAGHRSRRVDGDPDPSRTELLWHIVESFDFTWH